VNHQDPELSKFCIDYNKTQDTDNFVKEVSDFINDTANNFYCTEFTDAQLTSLQTANENDELEEIFKQFGESGNMVLFKNQLLEAIKPAKKKNTILGSLQSSLRGRVLSYHEPKEEPQ